ncbi:MAG TPA: HAD-IIIC family phosphatase [Acidimicrobiales bacterium]
MTAPLNLRDALGLITEEAGTDQATDYAIGLACSFTPLHLETFMKAYVLQRRPATSVRIETGIYGDLAGGLDQIGDAQARACVAVVEWPDLDPRLGCRETVHAPVAGVDDICATARLRLDRLALRLEHLGERCPVALVLPTLDLPAVYEGGRHRVGVLRARLNLLLAEFAERLVTAPGLSIVSAGNIAGTQANVRDLRSDIRSGFPYTVEHASAIAQAATDAMLPAPTKKGLITDLDDTMWRGLVGEIGADKVTWDLDSGSHVHAMYQQLLARLAERGTLLAVASKNDPEIVLEALSRSDLLVAADLIYPVAASWQPKSAAIAEILRAWNIAATDVVFVDDNPMELAEVAAKFPGITTRQFPTQDPNAVAELLSDLTDAFWKESVTDEDRLRRASLRSAVEVENARTSAQDEPAFLRDLEAKVTIETGGALEQPRALELVNKTNQFNLNGRRLDETQWHDVCIREGGIVWTVSYEDRFGPLGIISVLAGVRSDRTLTVDCWVLSCRAFSRGVEHHVLRSLGEQPDVDEILLEFVPTDRNGVVATMVEKFRAGRDGTMARLDLDAIRRSELSQIHAVLISQH